jgi:hypothetical protein
MTQDRDSKSSSVPTNPITTTQNTVTLNGKSHAQAVNLSSPAPSVLQCEYEVEKNEEHNPEVDMLKSKVIDLQTTVESLKMEFQNITIETKSNSNAINNLSSKIDQKMDHMAKKHENDMEVFTKNNSDNMNVIMELWSARLDKNREADRLVSINQFNKIGSKIDTSNSLALQLSSKRNPPPLTVKNRLTRSKSMIKKLSNNGEPTDFINNMEEIEVDNNNQENLPPNITNNSMLN